MMSFHSSFTCNSSLLGIYQGYGTGTVSRKSGPHPIYRIFLCGDPIPFCQLDAFPGDYTYTVTSLRLTDRLPELNQSGVEDLFPVCPTTNHRPRQADLAGRALSEIDKPDHPTGRPLALSSPGHNMGSVQLQPAEMSGWFGVRQSCGVMSLDGTHVGRHCLVATVFCTREPSIQGIMHATAPCCDSRVPFSLLTLGRLSHCRQYLTLHWF